MADHTFVINKIPWHTIYLMNDCRQHVDFFHDHISTAIEIILSTRIVKVSTSDPPQITP